MKQKKKQTRQGSDNRAFHLMLLVPVILLFIYNILPIPAGILMAFQNFHPMKGFLHSSFVGLANFKKLMLLPDTWPAVCNTLIIAIGKIIGNLVVPISFALLLNEIRVRWFKRAAQTITYLPYFLSWVVLGGILIKFLSPGSSSTTPGLLNTLLVNLHIIKEPIYFLGSNSTFRGTMIISDIWKNFGYFMVLYLSGLSTISGEYYDAAKVDGANAVQCFFKITLPLLRPITTFVVVQGAIGGFQLFDEAKTLVSGSGSTIVGGPGRSLLTIVWYFYDSSFQNNSRYGYGAAIAFSMLIIIAAISFLNVRLLREKE